MKNILVVILIYVVSACSVQKQEQREWYCYYRYKNNPVDSTNYTHYIFKSGSTIIEGHHQSIAVMDKEYDTIPKYRIEIPIPLGNLIFTSAGRDLFFFSKSRKAIIIHRDSHDKSTSELMVNDRCDSLDHLSPWDSENKKLMFKVTPDNGKYNYKCLTRNNTRIYIYNFKGEEMDNAVEMVKNSFKYLPYQ